MLPSGFFSLPELPSRRQVLTLAPACGVCKLSKGCKSPKMAVDGEGQKKILIVGEAPGAEEDAAGRPFVGKAGRYLQQALSECGIDLRRDCWITNSLICRPKNNLIDDDRKVDHCRPNLTREIRERKPEVIVLLGLTAVKSLIGWLWKEDIGAMTRWAGWKIPAQQINAWVCPTFHPSHVMREEEGSRSPPVLKLLWKQHLTEALTLRGQPWKSVPNYRRKLEVILSPSEAISRLGEIAAAGNTISFDYETTCSKPDSTCARTVCCAVSDGVRTIAYPWTKETRESTGRLLFSSQSKVGWNLKFEERWTRKEFGRGVKNWLWDGMLAAHILDNRRHITSLKFQAFVNLGVGAYDEAVKPYLKSAGSNVPNRIKEVPMHKLLEYGAMDALLEWQLCKLQMREMGV